MNYPDDPRLAPLIRAALDEDLGSGDHTTRSTIPTGLHAQAHCRIKDQGVLAGVALAAQVFAAVDPGLHMDVHLPDGSRVTPGDIAFTVIGDPRSILSAERVVLNFMQRMSGIATLTRQVVDRLEGLPCRLLDTRKTSPLLRLVERWAVHIGGGTNHRYGLYDMVMIKDNHIDYAGSISAAVLACRRYLAAEGLALRIEVETRTLDEVQEALDTGSVDRIMLDNMPLDMLRAAVTRIAGRCETEASGGITLDTVRAIAETGVDFVSMGALTHSARSLDISLKAVRR
ncbi:MAG: carboxylating nicotinate-nucleotide diphosphorylase [Bacteroidia bacterium]